MRGRSLSPPLIARAVGVAILLVLTAQVIGRGLSPAPGGVLGFFHLVNLVFHEAGHVIFGLFGQFLGMLGGSLNQVLMPAICTGYFLWHRRRAAAGATLFWTGESITDVAIYAADGRDMRLPLLAEGLTHDWNWILSELSLRNHAEPIGRAIFAAGVLTIAVAIALLAYDLARCWTAPDTVEADERG